MFFKFLFIVSVVLSHLGGNMLMIKRQSQIGDKRNYRRLFSRNSIFCNFNSKNYIDLNQNISVIRN